MTDIGNRIHAHIGEDRPELERIIEDTTGLWQDIYDQCCDRLCVLNDMLTKATSFHEQLMVSEWELVLFIGLSNDLIYFQILMLY